MFLLVTVSHFLFFLSELCCVLPQVDRCVTDSGTFSPVVFVADAHLRAAAEALDYLSGLVHPHGFTVSLPDS